MQMTKLSSIRCTVKIPGGIRGCAWSREGLGYQEEAAESPVAAGIKKSYGGYAELRRGIAVDLAAVFEKDQREMREELAGYL
jgi:hypothetical protein